MSDEPTATLVAPAATPAMLQLRFTASGSEYFRIWVVNLLLIVVTLGFYLPFAKARRLRYFYANTLVDGQPLAFHGDPWKMFRGYLVMLLLFGVYVGASYLSHWVAFGALLLLALLWPALWRSSLMFRMANTSWRGLRFAFEGTLSGAYGAMLPVFVPGLITVAASAHALTGIDPQDAEAMQAANMATLPAVGLSLLLTVCLAPLALWFIKSYQHGGYRWSSQMAVFDAPRSVFYKLAGKLLGVGLGLVVVLGLLVGLIVFLLKDNSHAMQLAAAAAGGLAYLVLIVVMGALMAAWMQNASWNPTRSQELHFDSRLAALGLSVLSLKNILLVIVTLGLYRPFAVVNVYRMRLEAVTVTCTGNINEWLATATPTQVGASGEMSGDFFGIDVGL
ncbi:MAG: YjgN family protein [Rubrivivax sp.]